MQQQAGNISYQQAGSIFHNEGSEPLDEVKALTYGGLMTMDFGARRGTGATAEKPTDLTIDEIIAIEPEIGIILRGIKPTRKGRRRRNLYVEAKIELCGYVGHDARNEMLETSQAYDAVMDIVNAKLNLPCATDAKSKGCGT